MAQITNTSRLDGIAALEAYWQALRGARSMPLRSEIDPRGIQDALDFTFIVERVTAGVARFRLAGSQLNELMGMDVRGMPITSMFSTNARSQMGQAIERVFDGPEIIEANLQSPSGAGKSNLSAQMILLPLRSDLGDVSRAIGCFPTQGEFGRPPRRFDVVGNIKRTPLDGGNRQFIPPQSEPTLIGMAEEHAQFKAAQTSSERPYLRLVKDE